MANIVFPSSPTTGQVFASGSSAWQWDGTAWRVVRNTGTSVQLGFNQINFFGASLQDALFKNGFLNQSLPVATANNWTDTQTFTGSASSLGANFYNFAQQFSIVSSARSSAVTVYVQNGLGQYLTLASTANWTTNITFSSTVKLNSVMTTGQSIKVYVLSTQGSTGYHSNTTGSITVDGATTTTYFQGGALGPTFIGGTNGIDLYVYTITKTGNAAFVVLADQLPYN